MKRGYRGEERREWRLTFVCDLVRRDLAAASPGDLAKLSTELLSFEDWKESKVMAPAVMRAFQSMRTPPPRKLSLTRSAARGLQRRVLEVVRQVIPSRTAFAASGRTDVEPVWVPVAASSETVLYVAGRHCSRMLVATWPASFWLALAQLLEQDSDRLRWCKECDGLFVRRGRAPKEYCSTGCSQKSRSRRWYEAHHEEALERRHLAYKKQHPWCKVPRRRRVGA